MKAALALESEGAALNAGLRLITSHLAKASLDTLAKAIQKEESQASRIRSEEVGAKISDVVRLLYTVGLKVVSADCRHGEARNVRSSRDNRNEGNGGSAARKATHVGRVGGSAKLNR